jgi:penicillin-insensitive murein endopeptidase
MRRLLLAATLAFAPIVVDAKESTCYGTTANGRLTHGVKLPSKGVNFTSYGVAPEMAGRTYVHSRVRDIVVEAYRILETEQPGKVFKYAETGFEDGGRFKPHKTHRNGLSIDFMVPVVDRAGASVHLPTHALNKYGYDIEFDARGRYGEYRIDYEALAAHIVALHRAAHKMGHGLWRVIFDPQLAPNLHRTRYGDYIRQHIDIPQKPSWVRHDEHYHVDFLMRCDPL